MRHTPQILRHPLEHRTEALWAIALGAAGQLLLGWGLAKAASSAAGRDLQPA